MYVGVILREQNMHLSLGFRELPGPLSTQTLDTIAWPQRSKEPPLSANIRPKAANEFLAPHLHHTRSSSASEEIYTSLRHHQDSCTLSRTAATP